MPKNEPKAPAAAPVEPVATPAPVADGPPTRLVRARTLHNDVRCRAGFFLPAKGWVDLEVTRPQLDELEADTLIEVAYEGRDPRGPQFEPEPVVPRLEHQRAIDELESRLRDQDAEHRERLALLGRDHDEMMTIAEQERAKLLAENKRLAEDLVAARVAAGQK